MVWMHGCAGNANKSLQPYQFFETINPVMKVNVNEMTLEQVKEISKEKAQISSELIEIQSICKVSSDWMEAENGNTFLTKALAEANDRAEMLRERIDKLIELF